MVVLAKLVGLIVMALGLAIFASPSLTQKIFNFIKEGRRIYYAGIVRAVIGLILFFAAPQSGVPLAANALGLMFLVSGIVVFATDLEKLKAFIKSTATMPILVIRLLGLVAASFGIVIFAIF